MHAIKLDLALRWPSPLAVVSAVGRQRKRGHDLLKSLLGHPFTKPQDPTPVHPPWGRPVDTHQHGTHMPNQRSNSLCVRLFLFHLPEAGHFRFFAAWLVATVVFINSEFGNQTKNQSVDIGGYTPVLQPN
jgi:hypothetical protein